MEGRSSRFGIARLPAQIITANSAPRLMAGAQVLEISRPYSLLF